MFFTNLEEDYKDDYFADDWLFDVDYSHLTDEESKCAEEIFDLLEEFIPEEEVTFNILGEVFTSGDNAAGHFRKHCMSNPSKKSKRSNVFYDFTKQSDYTNREALLNQKINSSPYNINDICDVKDVIKNLHKLFEGNICINFTITCGLYNNAGRVALSINSFATDVTTNYLYNTVDFIVRTPAGNTITIYPVDANYLGNKLNSIFTKCGFAPIKFNR